MGAHSAPEPIAETELVTVIVKRHKFHPMDDRQKTRFNMKISEARVDELFRALEAESETVSRG